MASPEHAAWLAQYYAEPWPARGPNFEEWLVRKLEAARAALADLLELADFFEVTEQAVEKARALLDAVPRPAVSDSSPEVKP